MKRNFNYSEKYYHVVLYVSNEARDTALSLNMMNAYTNVVKT